MKMSNRRRGSMLLEASMAVVISAVALIGVTQLLIASGRQQRLIQRRQAATRAAGNIMERVMVQPFADTTPEKLAGWQLPPEVSSRLPSSELRIVVSDTMEQAAMKQIPARQIQVEVAWHDISGQANQVRLVGWKYSPGP